MQDIDPKYLKKGFTPPKGAITNTVCSWCKEETTNIAWNCAKCGKDLRDGPPELGDSSLSKLQRRVLEKKLEEKAHAAIEDLETW